MGTKSQNEPSIRKYVSVACPEGPEATAKRTKLPRGLVLAAVLVCSVAVTTGGCRSQRARWRYGSQVAPARAPVPGVVAANGSRQDQPGAVPIDFDPVRVERLLSEHGCTACHTFHGERLVGPPLGGSFGSTRRFTDGTEAVVDRAYVVTSLYEPGRQVVEGFPNVMPSYEGILDEATAEDIAGYLASLR